MKLRSLLTTIAALSLAACSSGSNSGSGSTSTPTVTAAVSAYQLKDINTGIGANVGSGWTYLRGAVSNAGALVFLASNDEATAANSTQVWWSTIGGAATLLKDHGHGGKVQYLTADTRATSTASRVYWVNGLEIWTADLSTSTPTVAKIATLAGGTSIASAAKIKAIGNNLYYQVGTAKVYVYYAGAATPAVAEVQDSGSASYAAAVTFTPGTANMYIDNGAKIQSHNAATATYTSNVTTSAAVGAHGGSIWAAVGDDLYYVSAGHTYKSVAGGTEGEVFTNAAGALAATAIWAGTAHAYIDNGTGIWSHTGAAGNGTTVEATGTANGVGGSAVVVGDNLCYQHVTATDHKVNWSAAGAAGAQITGVANAVATLYAGSAHCYIDDGTGMFSATASGAATTVDAAGTAAGVAAISGDDLIYQAASKKIYASAAGAASVEVKDDNAVSFNNGGAGHNHTVSLVGGSAHFYIIDQTNFDVYTTTNAAGNATYAFQRAGNVVVGNAQVVKDSLFFNSTATPKGLFVSVAGASAIRVTGYTGLLAANDNDGCAGGTPVAVGANLFFVANDGLKGCELWTTSGTVASTAIVGDVNTGLPDSNPKNITVAGTRVWFTATSYSAAAGKVDKLYYTDSPYTSVTGPVTITGATTTPFASITSSQMTVAGNYIYFVVNGNADSTTELAGCTNATSGTPVCALVTTGTAGQFLEATATQTTVVNLNGTAMLNVADHTADATHYQLWKSTDGATASRVKNINNGANAALTFFATPTFNSVYNNAIMFFTANDGTNGVELWSTDGTAGNTAMVANINAAGNSSPGNLMVVGTKLFFSAVGNVTAGAQLYVLSGLSGASSSWTVTQLTGWKQSPSIASLRNFNSGALFTGSEDNGTNSSVYWTDGTSITRLYTDATANVPSFDPIYYQVASTTSTAYWTQTSTQYGGSQVLYKSDGTENGTGVVNFGLGPSQSTSPSQYSVVGTSLVMRATNGTNNFQLWAVNSSGAAMIKDISPNQTQSAAPNLVGVTSGGAYYFVQDPSDGIMLYYVH